VYEESKWEAEQIWIGRATIFRPGIIVGHSDTARCTSFSGWYILFQSTHLLDRLLRDVPNSNRRSLEIDVPSDPAGTTNIIPVDYVAEAAVRIMEDPSDHNKIYHLTHPNPPCHQWTLDYICRKFDLGGFHLIGEGTPFTQPRNAAERMVWRQVQAILFHFSNNPSFDRTNTDTALPDLEVPPITEDFMDKLVDYAIEKDWGQSQH
jgi:thioester reductase-like protein